MCKISQGFCEKFTVYGTHQQRDGKICSANELVGSSSLSGRANNQRVTLTLAVAGRGESPMSHHRGGCSTASERQTEQTCSRAVIKAFKFSQSPLRIGTPSPGASGNYDTEDRNTRRSALLGLVGPQVTHAPAECRHAPKSSGHTVPTVSTSSMLK